MVTPAGFKIVGRGVLGNVPPASSSIAASCWGLGLGKPSVVGMLYGADAVLLYGAAAVLVMAAETANRFLRYIVMIW